MSKETLTLITAAFTDLRGVIANVLSDYPLRHVAVIQSRAGAVRGNHYHPNEDQFMYCLSGSYIAFSQEAISPDNPIEWQIVSAGQLAYCPPRLAHAYVFLEDTVFLNLTPAPRLSGKPEVSQIPWLLTPSGNDPRDDGRHVITPDQKDWAQQALQTLDYHGLRMPGD